MTFWCIFLSLLGFLLLFLSDWYQGKRKRPRARIFGIIGYFCSFLGTSGYVLYGLRGFTFGPIANWFLIAGLLLLLGLLIKSLVIDLRGHSEVEDGLKMRKATKKGTYSFSRHPGFLWYCLLFIIIDIYVGEVDYVLGSLVLISGNCILIVLEDILLFPRIFDNYNVYKKEVPFLIPIKWKKKRK